MADDSGLKGKYLDEKCAHCAKHAAPFATFSRCGRCKIPKYCSRECQGLAWAAHKAFCREPSLAPALEQQAVRDRIKSGHMTPAKAADHIVSQHLQREFVLASGERALATSGSVPRTAPFFSVLAPRSL